MRHVTVFSGRITRVLSALVIATIVCVLAVSAQPKYRTFLQHDLAEKKAKAGKVLGSRVSFTFKNPRIGPCYGIHAIFSSPILSIETMEGFTSMTITDKKVLDMTGPGVMGGDSVTFTAVFANKEPGTKVNFWWWTDAVGDRRTNTGIKLLSKADAQLYVQPNGGNVLLYVYKNLVQRPAGVSLGIPTEDMGLAMVRNLAFTKNEFPHTGTPRCFDKLVSSSGIERPFVGVKKNLVVKKHNNHLMGELHALKLAIIANDAFVTEPTDPSASRLGDLLYGNPADASDPNNGLTIRQIAARTDSLLTFCGSYESSDYTRQDATLSMINGAFNGPYQAVSFEPFVLAGAQSIAEVPFLHTAIGLPPAVIPQPNASIIDEAPVQFQLSQNYPNPFNPTTTIDFTLPEASLTTLKIYNMLGQEVATLFDNEMLDEGEQTADFNAASLTSGVYFYKLVAQGEEDGSFYQETRRMMLVK
jgi:hypothetical protein